MVGGPANTDTGTTSATMMAAATSTTTKKRSKPGGGLASKLFDKFDSDRRYDPFLDADPVIQDSKEGMETLLSMCNAVEINSLFGALGFVVPCPRKAKEQQIMAFIREGGRQVGKRFAEVLKLFWEGLLFEYLRSEGCPLRDGERDPRHFIIRYWRRSLLDPSVRPGFVPFYLKREAKKRNSIIQEDRDIRDIRAGLIIREERVKDAETRVRGQHDYRFVLQYFSASRDLHRTLVGDVTFLANEVEQLRANVDHSSESISIMEQQFVELETKYDRVVGGLVHREAFQLTVEGTLYGIINEGNVSIKAAERMATALLADMDVGLQMPAAGAESDISEVNGNINEGDVALLTDAAAAEAVAVAAAAAATAAAATSSTTPGGQEGTRESAEMPNVDQQRTWAAPRSKGRHNRGDETQGCSSGEIRETSDAAAAVEAAPPVSEGCRPGESCLESCLRRVWDTHRTSCASYANRVAELEAQNVALIAEASAACRLREEASAQARAWEERHSLLEQRIADVESRSRAELLLAQQSNSEASSRVREANALLKGALERATPTLVGMVAAFAAQDTEELAVDLFLKLGVERDLYAHHLATKRMFEADLESRAFEILDEDQKSAAVGEGSVGHDEAAASRKKERGRPKSRGNKGKGGAADKSKSGKSRSKTPAGKVGKAADKGDKDDDRGAGKGKGKAAAGKGKGKQKRPQAEKGPPPGDNSGASEGKRGSDRQGPAKAQRSSSPAKKGAAKGIKQRKH